jgi:type III secretion protein C
MDDVRRRHVPPTLGMGPWRVPPQCEAAASGAKRRRVIPGMPAGACVGLAHDGRATGLGRRACFATTAEASGLRMAARPPAPTLRAMPSNLTPTHPPHERARPRVLAAARALMVAGCLAAGASAIGAATAPASAAPFGDKRFVYRADDKKLAEVLQDFGASQNVPVVIDAGVTGTVNANFNERPRDFLATITRTYGVIWYFDGTTLFIYPSQAMQSKLFRMRGYDRAQVRNMLKALGLGDPRFPLRFDDASQTLLAYGPPRHIELVSTVLEQLERNNRDRVGTSIEVVRLRFATAADRVVGNTRIEGLASSLNSLFSNGDKGADTQATVKNAALDTATNAATLAERMRSVQSTYGFKLQANTPTATPGVKRDDGTRANQLDSARPAQSYDEERPFFQADESTNAIIVRGLPDRMPEYAALIRQLDVQQDLVEIEASIIDVNSDDFDSLGIDWTFTENGVTRFSMSPGSPSTSSGMPAADTLTSANITTLIGSAGKQLLSHILLLQGKGKARILARPKVLGSVNRTATMSDKRTASVRVAGNLDANLFSVEAGTTLSVTPQIIAYDDHREVHLALQIQDGNFEGTSVDSVPIVKQTEIDTEAVVREGESLLVGGISVESDNNGTTGIPGLSSLPLVGALFRHHEAARSRTERLFLLTPKIVQVGLRRPAAVAPQAPSSAAPGSAPAASPASAVPGAAFDPTVPASGPMADGRGDERAAAPARVAAACRPRPTGPSASCVAGGQ